METICIVCPNGCHLSVEKTENGLVVSGNKCLRGIDYGKAEATDPRRMVTAVAATSSSQWPCAPVKTAQPIPKKMIQQLLQEIASLKIDLPVKRGDVVIKNFVGTDVAVVITRTIPPEYHFQKKTI